MAQAGGATAFGEQLRRAREERGVALETICEATKVPARHYRALEAGDLQELPGGVFRRAFVRSYLGGVGGWGGVIAGGAGAGRVVRLEAGDPPPVASLANDLGVPKVFG